MGGWRKRGQRRQIGLLDQWDKGGLKKIENRGLSLFLLITLVLMQQPQYQYNRKMINNQLPRVLKYNHRDNIQDFVLGSSWNRQEYQRTMNLPPAPQPHISSINYHPHPYPQHDKVSLFDKYNKNNLLLTDCHPQDIQIITSNPIAYQQNIQINIPSQKQLKSQTLHNIDKYYPQSSPNISDRDHNSLNAISNEAKVNEFLFNYKKNAQQKKQKKTKFLDEIQRKLEVLEREAQVLESQKGKEGRQIQEMLNLQEKITDSAKKNVLVGQINTAIYQSMPETQEIPEPRNIEQEMNHLEVNYILEDHHKYNNYLLELADKVTSKSRSKQKKVIASSSQQKKLANKKLGDTFNKTQNSLNQTVKKSFGVPPKPKSSHKLVKTWKQMRKK